MLGLHEGTHTLATHCVVPCALVHAMEQLPQVPTLDVRFDSQPFVFGTAVTQSPNPVLQPEYVHFEPSHAAPLLFVVSHTRPQPLQFVMVLVAVSHPFVFGAVVMQSPHPPVHAYEHVVPLQPAVPCV